MVMRRKGSGRWVLPGGRRLSQKVYVPVLVPVLTSWVTWTLKYSGTQFSHLKDRINLSLQSLSDLKETV